MTDEEQERIRHALVAAALSMESKQEEKLAHRGARGMRQQIGLFLLILGSITKFLAWVFIVLFVAGIWWQMIQPVLDAPLQALWRIPLAIILSGIGAFILRMIYNVLALPLVALTVWLLRESES